MKITFIKNHDGQKAKVGDEKEIEDFLAKHLIRFGYAQPSGFHGLETATKKAGKDVEKRGGDNDA